MDRRAPRTRRFPASPAGVFLHRALRRELSDGKVLMKKLIGSSPLMERLREDILDLGQSDGHVLIEGETGTGKTLIAHALHAVGSRAGKKFVLLSCAAMDEDALMQRLFGPMQPEDTRLPAMEEARGGTLVLEDIESLTDSAQARLLSVINDQGTPPETRIVAICNLQDEGRTCESALRPDLYYRLAGATLSLPPLRHRADFDWLLDRLLRRRSADGPQLSTAAKAELKARSWPGNIRELERALDVAVTLAEGPVIDLPDLPRAPAAALPAPLPEADLEATLIACGWNMSQVARRLGVNRSTVLRRVRKAGLTPPE